MADVINPSITTRQVLETAARLQQMIQPLPADARRDKAIYHLDRLQRAVTASHQEAVRFAAFTVSKTVHDAAADWGAPVVAAMSELREALHARGHEF